MACFGEDPKQMDNSARRAATDQVFSGILALGLDESDTRLAGMTRLTDEEIRQAIVGRTIVEDRPPGTGMPHPQGERFRADGKVDILGDRAIQRDVSYSIRDRAVCISRSPRINYCKAFFKSPDGRLFQAFFRDGRIAPIKFIDWRG